MQENFSSENAALVLIDHQLGTMKLIQTLKQEDVKKKTLALAKAAKILGMPAVLTSSQEQNVQGPILEEFADILPEAYENRIQRIGIVNAWDDGNFVKAIEATGRKNLVMAGVTTDVCLVFPAISAVRDGYNVQVVLDASGSPYELSEGTSRTRMENEGVVLTATNTMLAELAKDWSRPEGGELLGIMFQDVLPAVF